MTSPVKTLKLLGTGIVLCGAAGVCLTTFGEERTTDRDPDLDVRLSVDYARGEDPARCHALLEKRMMSADYAYTIFPAPGESGTVGMEVDDDHLPDALRRFRGVLRETDSPHQLVVREK